MKKNIKIIIIIVIAVLLILGLVVLINRNNDKSSNKSQIENSSNFDIDLKEDYKIKEVSNRNSYYTVKTCIEKFFLFYSDIYSQDINIEGLEDVVDNSQEEEIEAVYSMLDDEYIKYNNLTTQNFKSKFQSIDGKKVSISKMYQKQVKDYIYVYFVEGVLIDEETFEKGTFSMIVKLDTSNQTFKILLQDYINNKYESIEKAIENDIQIDVSDSIKNDIYNIYENKNISNEEYISDIFGEYRDLLVYDRQEAYNKLDEQYRNKRFGSYKKFDEFIQENIKNLVVMKLSKYQTNTFDNYTQYVAIDTNSNYYIFNETKPMKYTVILDQYTVDLPQFIEKYQAASDENKAKMNVEKVKEALNAKDYSYIYNKLDETFKKNNYNSVEKLEEYFKQNLYEKNSFKNATVEVQNDVYIFSITVSDESSKVSKNKTMDVVIKLGENTDYTMSFSIK